MPQRLNSLAPVLALLMAMAGLSACQRPGTDPKGGADSAPKAPLLIAPEDVRSVSASGLAGGPVITGAIQPARRADLRAEVAAVVLEVGKDNGERVRRGDLIVRLDATSIRDSLASAEEALRAAKQGFEQSERVLARQRTLNQQGMTSMQALEDAEVRRNAAQSELAAANARVVTARQQMSRTELRAPFDGLVTDRKVSVGDTVQVGREIVKVIDPTSMRFEGQVSADRLSELKVGQGVSFRVNGFGDQEFVARLSRIDAAANATTRQVEVAAAFEPGASLPQVAGLYAEGRIDTGARQALTVAESAVVREGDDAFVWQVMPEQLRKTKVVLGARDPRRGEVVIARGLVEGDRVLRAPGSQLMDGQKIQRVAAGAGVAAASQPAARR
ncbi:MAG: efflux RND transporter periplasmic adaptor subunit [Inhella sp.]|jgi:RND family efflux transporter MFP subunit|uniref:efflux RND transporter periplasmic adaptor subunit n=1 Tax=Inhella sp. TaxID=1921806 RepID=UPI0022BDB9A6|nr:efflux RND transporter periplasmic adaptor subunit [Inhella sp.]MCZ8236056.1 efflux RND transporter periplasmic adaptor subunit [Inhella sp.]